MPDGNPEDTHWLALRLDADVRDMRTQLRTVHDRLDKQAVVLEGHTALHRLHTRRFDRIEVKLEEHDARFDVIDERLQEHDARFDSVDSSLQSLTQMVGEVLNRLPEEPEARP